MKRLSARSMQVAQYMMDVLKQRDSMPTMVEISQHFGWSSANSAQTHLDALIDGGVLEKYPGKSRGYRFKDRSHFQGAMS